MSPEFPKFLEIAAEILIVMGIVYLGVYFLSKAVEE